MMEKLEISEESDSKTALLQNLENKIVDLQAQLRTVREQIEKGLVGSDKTVSSNLSSKSYVPNPFSAYRGGGAPAGGRSSYRGRGYNPGYRGGGRGSAGRGRGGRFQNPFVNSNVFGSPSPQQGDDSGVTANDSYDGTDS
jgi:hypothetical protein